MADKKRNHELYAAAGRHNRQRPALHDRPHAGRGGKQPHAGRHMERTGCANPEVRKGIGGVIFAVGVPTAIAGIVMTVVDATDNENEKKYPPAFAYVGPIVIAVAVIFFLVGIILSTPLLSNAINCCFSLDDPNSFCRINFPRLSHWIDPENTISRNQAALKALQTEPGKSVLKHIPLPPNDRPVDNGLTISLNADIDGPPHQPPAGYQTPVSLTNVDVVSEQNRIHAHHGGTKGVRFSESESDAGSVDVSRARVYSAASDNSSVLSTRHCKVYPKESKTYVWHTECESKVLLPPQPATETEVTEL